MVSMPYNAAALLLDTFFREAPILYQETAVLLAVLKNRASVIQFNKLWYIHSYNGLVYIS